MKLDAKRIRTELELDGDPKTGRVLDILATDAYALDINKRDAIRAAIVAAAEKSPSPERHMRWNVWHYLLPVGAVALLVVFVASQSTTLLGTKSSVTGTRKVAVLDRNAFGALPAFAPTPVGAALTAETSGAVSNVAKDTYVPATTLALATKVAAPDAPQAGNQAAAVAFGMGGGTATAVVGSAPSAIARPMPCLNCGQNLAPRVVYKFEGTMPEIPAEVPVFRLGKFDYPDATAVSILSPLGLTGFGKLTLQNASFIETGTNPLSWSFDAYSNYVYFNASGNYRLLGDTETTDVARKTITDDEALRAVAAFLASHGVDVSGYGLPKVERQDYGYPCKYSPCPMMEVSSGAATKGIATPPVATDAVAPSAPTTIMPSIYPSPYQGSTLVVTYAAIREGKPVLNWDGSEYAGISVTIDGATGEITNGNIMLVSPTDRSLYPSRKQDEILADALRGGLAPYYYYNDGGIYTPDEEKRRPVVTVAIKTAGVGYVEKVSDDNQTRYLIPVVGFRGSLKDQFGNVSDWGTIVPIVQGSAGTVTSGGGSASGVEIMPVPSAIPSPKPPK